MAGEPDAAHEVLFDDGEPVFVGDFLEGFRLIDAQVIDEDLDLRVTPGGFRGRIGVREVEGKGLQICLRVGCVDMGNGFADAGFGAAIEDDAGALGGEEFGDGKSDAGGGACNKREVASELEVPDYLVIEREWDFWGRETPRRARKKFEIRNSKFEKLGGA